MNEAQFLLLKESNYFSLAVVWGSLFHTFLNYYMKERIHRKMEETVKQTRTYSRVSSRNRMEGKGEGRTARFNCKAQCPRVMTLHGGGWHGGCCEE